MKCPKCSSAMEQLIYDGIEVDRCTFCKGLFFDAGEKEVLRNSKAAATIDTGDTGRGGHTNAIDRCFCPRCAAGMVRMVDVRQSHIWFEQCSSCGGSFFDAGEFTDLSKHTISDFFRRLATPERR